MSEPRRGNRDLIKAMNRNLVLNMIRTQGPLSRTQLTEVTGLSVGAVSQITNDLLAGDWILAVGEGDYTGGRRQMMLRLNPTKGHVIGLKLTESQVFCALTDLETKVMKYIEQPLNCEHTPEAISDVIGDVVKRAIFEADVARSQILGVGIGLAGIVDNQLGIVRYSPFFHWRNIPLAKLVGDRLALPVYVENDVNTLTITEQLFGPGRTVENFAVVTVGRGVGMGMVLNHRLYQGGAGGTGEIGHITLDPNGPQCDCGKRGCLESLASDPAVISYVEQQLAAGVDSVMISPLELSDIIQAADEDDQLARHALARSGRYLGMGLSVVVNMLTPTLIIVSGEGVVAGDYRLQSMFEALSEHSFGNLMENIEIVVEPTNDQSWARGAAGFVVGKLFESPLISAHQPDATG